jgi:hypothetical protein
MDAESKIRGLLDFAARAVLLDAAEVQAAIDEAERKLPGLKGIDQLRLAADIEMARKVLVYTAAYAEIMKEVTRDYRRRIIHTAAVEDALKKG